MSALLSEAAESRMPNQVLTIERVAAPALDNARERPRVLHLVTSFEAGGTERQFVELLKRLDRDRFDLRLAALRVEGPFYQEIADAFPAVPEFRLTSFYNRNALRQLTRLRALIRRERIDIIHTHGFYDSLFGAVAGRLSGIRVIASQRHLRLSERRAHDYGTRAIHRLAHRIIVNSVAIRDAVIRGGSARADKIVVIHNGLCESDGRQSRDLPGIDSTDAASPRARVSTGGVTDSREFRRRLAREALGAELRMPPEAKVVGMVARLVAVKGHSYFLGAAEQVARQDGSVHFVLIGDGPLRDELEGQAARLGIGDRVHFLGDRKDARQLVSAFDVSVLTSLSEGLPNTVMEAMSAGVPVIATAVGGTNELIQAGETGYLIPPADAGALAERLRFALCHEAASRAVAERGREFITSRFSMRRMVESVERLYDEMMAGVKGGRM